MTCKSCDECTSWNPFPWIEDGKLCDLIPDTWTAEDIQRAKDNADWIASVIKECDARTTDEQSGGPYNGTDTEDSSVRKAD